MENDPHSKARPLAQEVLSLARSTLLADLRFLSPALCRLDLCLYCLIVGKRLIAFLCRHHALVVETLHAVIRFLRNFQSGLCLLKQSISTVDLFATSTVVCHLVHGRCSALSALSLCELSLHVGSIDDGERVANIHIVALLDTQFEHTSRHLARHAIFRHLDISLYNFRLALENKSADNSYYYNHDGESRHREQYVLMLCFFRHNVCFYCSVPSAFLRFT